LCDNKIEVIFLSAEGNIMDVERTEACEILEEGIESVVEVVRRKSFFGVDVDAGEGCIGNFFHPAMLIFKDTVGNELMISMK
jgi:hypothetical protein